MSADYTSKTVLITGAGSGLGLSLTRHFLAANATVLALDISDASLASLPSKFDDVPEHRARLHPVKADITDPASVSAAIASWVDVREDGAVDKGERRLDVLVNNAGISDLMHPTADCPMAMWDRQILVNMTGSFVTSQRAIQQFLKQEPVDGQRGVILNVISAAGVHGARAGVAYTASKHGTVGLTRSTAAFYGPKGIRCLAIMPGPMMTNMARDEEHIKEFHPEGLAMVVSTFNTCQGDPTKGGWDLGWSPLDQVSKTVVSLCSGGMNTINGALVPTDMGWTSL
ncbi:bacilysin biosynthesis oxidoreductase bacC [Colletotrichum acutatum]|uniref:Bacilysin biosynthesis oxidoreductase bacC n=1 Tax=Glomerella acutata TaxID=27357 RepID=A0AAD8UCV9_GLOAC|nr:bacilysin biosynthesis oxidoreductase bacC [Colletotrichum acutatum]KAK1711917.1 bacilysin biosynthesis oxidoreductase bacC [Colletotrichum acutatum]